MNKRAAYIMGVYAAGVDRGLLQPTPLEKMAQQAEVAAGATMDEVGMVGSSITAQDISSMAKILSVLTQLQQVYNEQMMMPPEGMPPEGMPPQGMPPQGMPPQGMPPQGMQAPMGPPPQGMQAPGPGPAMQ